MDPADFVAAAEAVRRYPQLAGLHALATAGWRFRLHEPGGTLIQVDGFRCWPHGVTDALSLRSETDARGLRTVGDEAGIVWQDTGTMANVVDKLLNLPDPASPLAPSLIRGAAPRLWTPGR